MPLREPISFSPFAVTAMTTSSGHSALVEQRLGEAVAAVGRRARVHLDEPAEDRARRGPGAEARDDAALARRSASRPNAASAARTSAANPDADDASPAPVGKLLRLATRDARVDACLAPQQVDAGRDLREVLVAALAVERRARRARSSGVSSTVVSVNNASSVIEIEPTAGTFRRASALPQYLTSAKLAPARARACATVRA